MTDSVFFFVHEGNLWSYSLAFSRKLLISHVVKIRSYSTCIVKIL